jgi:sugar phosphate permease
MFTLVVAFIDRVNVSVMIADKSFLAEMGIAGDPVTKGMLMSMFMICYGLGNIILGPVGDWLGPRKAMLISIAAWSAACVAGSLATSIMIFLASRAFLGFGEGLHWPMQSKFIKNWFPNHERGKANSVWILGMNLAPVIAMPMFAALILALGWRGTMDFLAVLGILPFLLIWFFTADHPHLHRSVNKAEREYIEQALAEEREAEAKAEKPSVVQNMKTIVADYRFWLIVTYYSMGTTINFGIMTWLPSYLKDARGFSWAAMGALASLPFVCKMISTILCGYASDKSGRRAPFGVFALYGSSALLCLGAFIPNNWASAILIALGTGVMASGTPAVWALLQRLVPSHAVGTGAGMMNGFSQAVAAFGPVAMGALISLTGSYVGGLMYLVASGLVGGTAMLILAYKKL